MVKMSVVIPTFNEEKNIANTFKSINAQTFKDYEIVIADGESKDRTLAIARKYTKQIISGKDKSVAAARNKILNYTKGEIIVYIDADVRLYPTVLERINKIMADESVSGGFFYNTPWDGTFATKIIYFTVCSLSPILSPLGYVIALGPCMFFRKKVLEKLKGFDEDVILDDVEIFKRLQENKHKIVRIRKPVKVSARKLTKQNTLKYAKEHITIWRDVIRGKKETRVHHDVYKPIR